MVAYRAVVGAQRNDPVNQGGLVNDIFGIDPTRRRDVVLRSNKEYGFWQPGPTDPYDDLPDEHTAVFLQDDFDRNLIYCGREQKSEVEVKTPVG